MYKAIIQTYNVIGLLALLIIGLTLLGLSGSFNGSYPNDIGIIQFFAFIMAIIGYILSIIYIGSKR